MSISGADVESSIPTVVAGVDVVADIASADVVADVAGFRTRAPRMGAETT